jgi:hypothetical protein
MEQWGDIPGDLPPRRADGPLSDRLVVLHPAINGKSQISLPLPPDACLTESTREASLELFRLAADLLAGREPSKAYCKLLTAAYVAMKQVTDEEAAAAKPQQAATVQAAAVQEAEQAAEVQAEEASAPQPAWRPAAATKRSKLIAAHAPSVVKAPAVKPQVFAAALQQDDLDALPPSLTTDKNGKKLPPVVIASRGLLQQLSWPKERVAALKAKDAIPKYKLLEIAVTDDAQAPEGYSTEETYGGFNVLELLFNDVFWRKLKAYYRRLDGRVYYRRFKNTAVLGVNFVPPKPKKKTTAGEPARVKSSAK